MAYAKRELLACISHYCELAPTFIVLEADTELKEAGTLRLLEIIGQCIRDIVEFHITEADFRNLGETDQDYIKNWIGFRNKLAHGYLSIDMGIVRESVAKDLPELRQRLDWLDEIARKQP